MATSDHVPALTPAERIALETPELRQRTLALVAAADFAGRIAMDSKAEAALSEKIRSMDKAEAKKTRLVLSQASELLEAAGIDTIITDAAEKTETQTASLKERLARRRPRKSSDSSRHRGGRSATKVVQTLRSDEAEEVGSVLENLLEAEQRPELQLPRVETLLESLRKQGVSLNMTAVDVSHKTVEQLARLYVTYSNKSDPRQVQVNCMVAWGHLAGLDMSELVQWRKTSKADAGSGDVHNSRQSFVSGIAYAWRQAMAKGIDPQTFLTVEESLDQTTEEYPTEALESTADIVAESEQPTADDEFSVPPEPLATEVPETQVETMMETEFEEPVQETDTIVGTAEPSDVDVIESEIKEPSTQLSHDSLANEFYERLQLDINKVALAELFNPFTKGELTRAKITAADAIAQLITRKGDDILNDLDTSSQGRATLRRLLGVGFVKHGQVVSRPPEPLRDQLKNLNLRRREAFIQDTFEALRALLDILTADTINEPVATSLQPEFSRPAVKKVIMVDGKAQLQ